MQILSIAKALPLQIHPNTQLAAQLHEKEPEKFTDTNHKPEIAVALGKFEVFAGWKRNEDIQALFDSLEPLQKFLPNKNDRITDRVLRKVCTNIFNASDSQIKSVQRDLANIPRETFGPQDYVLDLLPRLHGQYSAEDPGNLVALLWVSTIEREVVCSLTNVQSYEFHDPIGRRSCLYPG